MTTASWSLVALILLLVSTQLVASARPDTSTVARWHNITWAAAFALLATNWIHYTPASTAAWLKLLLALFAFNLGVLAAPRRSDTPDAEPDPRTATFSLLSRGQLFVLTVVYLIGFAVYLRVVASTYGLHTILSDPEEIRTQTSLTSYIGLVPFWARLFIFLGPMLLVAYAWKPAVRRPLPVATRWIGVLVMAGSQIALLQRTNLFLGVLWLVAVIVCAPGRTRRRGVGARRLTRLAVLGVVLFVVFQGLAGALNKTTVVSTGDGVISPVLTRTSTVAPFLYATSGTMAFLHLTESQNHGPIPPASVTSLRVGDWNPQTWGRATGSLFLKAVPLAEPHDPIAPFIDIGVLTNVFTWYEPLYRDFRLLGILFGSIFLGSLLGSLYSRRQVSRRAFWLTTALMAAMFHAPFVALYTSTIWVVGIAMVILLTRPRRSQAESEPGPSRSTLAPAAPAIRP